MLGDGFIHLAVCLTTGPKPLPKRALHTVRSRNSSFKWEYPLLSLRSSSSFLRLLPRLPVTSIPPFIFPLITCCRRQFLRKMWSILLDSRFLISCRIFLCALTDSWERERKKKKPGLSFCNRNTKWASSFYVKQRHHWGAYTRRPLRNQTKLQSTNKWF